MDVHLIVTLSVILFNILFLYFASHRLTTSKKKPEIEDQAIIGFVLVVFIVFWAGWIMAFIL